MAERSVNNMIANIKNEEDVLEMWAEMARRAYALMPHAIPWEKEATWAGKTAGMARCAV